MAVNYGTVIPFDFPKFFSEIKTYKEFRIEGMALIHSIIEPSRNNCFKLELGYKLGTERSQSFTTPHELGRDVSG